MALVRETGRVRDLAQRESCRRELPAGVFDAQAAQVYPDRAAEPLAEDARQMNRMNARDFGHIFEDERLRKIVVQKLSGAS